MIAALVALLVALTAAVFLWALVAGGERRHHGMDDWFGTDDEPSPRPSNVDVHRVADVCTLPGCPLHGGDS